MTHDAAVGLGLILFAAVPGIVATSAFVTRQVSIGRENPIFYDRVNNPIVFWSYTLLFGVSAVGLAGYGLVLLVKGSFS